MRPVLTEAGEVGVYGEGCAPVVLRPTLRNIAQLGSPEEIVALFPMIMGPVDLGDKWGPLLDATGILIICSEGPPESVWRMFGTGGFVRPEERIILARHMLTHGVIGALEGKPGGEPLKEFRAADFVALAVAHLGLGVADAWDLTMTSLVQALKAKFPDLSKPHREGPSVEELEAAMKWYEPIGEARKHA